MAAEPPVKLDYKSRRLVSQIVEHVKSQGIFDQFRRDCIDELEQKESYRQLKQRVESHVATFLSKQTWTDALPKNQVRDSLRKHINQSEVLDRGVKQLISQALDSKAKVFQTRIEGVVQNYIYTQKYPQNQDKQTRKRKTVEDKEETKPTSSEVICDISQLIPTPCSSGSKTESHGAEKGKSGLQESSKSVTVKGGQPVKKSYPTQGKSSILAGKADETKTGSPAREKDQAEEISRIKDGKTRISRVKVEGLSRDDNSQLLPKSEESVPKVKDEKTKISRIKLENYNPSENSRSPADSGNLNSQDEKISSLKGIRENLVPKQLCPTDEAGFSQGDVTGLLQVKVEKTNKNESDSYDFATSENKIKVKEERSEAFGVKTEVESGETQILQEQEKFLDDSEKGLEKNLFDNGLSKADAEIQRSDNFVKTAMVEEMGERVVAKAGDVQDTPVVVDGNIAKELEGIKRLESLKQTETVGKLEKKSGNKREEKRDSGTESCVKKRSTMAADVSRVKTIDFKAAKSDDELSAGEKIGATELSSVIDKSQTMSDERGPLSWQKDDVSKTEPVHEKMGSENPSMVAESVGHASSTGEYSDGESDISEVSSVHTSDLSSFDEEISSSSESIYDQEEEACEAETNEETEEKDQERSSAQPQSEQDSDAVPMRRSTRISSRRSTKEGESEISGNEGSKIQTGSPRKRRHGEKRERKPHPERDIKERSEFDAEKRKRGRPRKEERQASNQSSTQMRRSRTRDRDGSRTAAERSGSGSRGDRRKRSQRQIKRTRCYSPSSEGTREVFLPRKRSRDGPNWHV